MADRVRFVLEQRGYDPRNVRAVTHGDPAAVSPLVAKRKLETLPEFTESDGLQAARGAVQARAEHREEPRCGSAGSGRHADRAGGAGAGGEVDRLAPVIEAAVKSGTGYRQAFAEAAKAGPAVAKFFDDVMVMADDLKLRDARLRLLRRLEGLILQLADVSEIVPEEK